MDLVLLIHDAGETNQLGQLPGHADSFAAPAKESAAGEITSEEYEDRRAKLLRDTKMR